MRRISTVLLTLTLLSIPQLVLSDNIALNKPVTLNGTFFAGGGSWGPGGPALAETIVDGIFVTPGTQWNIGTVWWDTSYDDGNQFITIDLNGLFSVDSFIVQADDNDSYRLSYWDLVVSDWKPAWQIPAVGGWGMRTRPNDANDTEKYFLGSPIVTNLLKIEGLPGMDTYYSVSEIQAYGTPIPEPTTMILLGFGLLGIAATSRRKS